MPFQDKEWQELQRDCDIFPAYSDYLYGPDERLVVTQEPGLHPQIYPSSTHTPIRYTNSMPSRSWTYKRPGTSQGSMVAAWTRQSLKTSGQGAFSGDRSTRSRPSLDVRSQMGSPIDTLESLQGVPEVFQKDKNRRQSPSASRNVAHSLHRASPSFLQQPVRLTRGQAPAKQGPACAATELPLHYPSSTTDNDEHISHAPLRQLGVSLSSATTILPHPDYLSQQLQNATGYPNSLPRDPLSGPFVAANAKSFVDYHRTSSPEPRCPALIATKDVEYQVPILKPDDMITNSLYMGITLDRRLELHRELVRRWSAVHDASDASTRAVAMTGVENISAYVCAIVNSAEEIESGKRKARDAVLQHVVLDQGSQEQQARETQEQPGLHGQVQQLPPVFSPPPQAPYQISKPSHQQPPVRMYQPYTPAHNTNQEQMSPNQQQVCRHDI